MPHDAHRHSAPRTVFFDDLQPGELDNVDLFGSTVVIVAAFEGEGIELTPDLYRRAKAKHRELGRVLDLDDLRALDIPKGGDDGDR